MKKIILVAGATGDLGLRIVNALANKNAEIRAKLDNDRYPEMRWTSVKDVLLQHHNK